MVLFKSFYAVSYSPSVVTMVLYCIRMIRFEIKSPILVANCDFFIPPLHSTPPLKGAPSVYCHPVWQEKKLERWGYLKIKKMRICVTVYTQYRRVTDGQTDGRTDILPCQSALCIRVARQKRISCCQDNLAQVLC